VNYYECNGHVFDSTLPSNSAFCPAEINETGISSTSYDLVSGTLMSSALSQGDFGAGSGAGPNDVYVVQGPEFRCVAFQVNLHVMARFNRKTLFAEGQLDAYVQDLASGVPPFATVKVRTSVTTVTDTTLSLPLSYCTDVPFHLFYDLETGAGYGDYHSMAQFSFSGLPPGYSVVSCQGFRSEQPIATMPSTWGRLKASYR